MWMLYGMITLKFSQQDVTEEVCLNHSVMIMP